MVFIFTLSVKVSPVSSDDSVPDDGFECHSDAGIGCFWCSGSLSGVLERFSLESDRRGDLRDGGLLRRSYWLSGGVVWSLNGVNGLKVSCSVTNFSTEERSCIEKAAS